MNALSARLRMKLATIIAPTASTDPEKRALNSGNLWPSFGAFNAGTVLPTIGPVGAFMIPPVSAAVQLLSQEIATLPLKVLFDDGEERREAIRHPAYNLLRWQPNDLMTARQWREVAQVHVCLYGNSFTEIVFDTAGRPRALWLLEPWKVQQFTNDVTREVLYEYQPADGDKRLLLPSQVLHIRWLTSGSGLWGESPVLRCADAIGLTHAAQSFAAKFYEGGAHLSGVLSHPTTLGEKAFESLKQSWKESHTGQRQAHSVAILEEGMSWTPTSVSPEDGQMLPTREFQVAEVARIFGVPAFRIGGASDTNTYSNIEQETIAFYRNSMRPVLVNWEQEIKAKMLARNFFADFDMSEVLRPDVMTRYNGYASAITAGWLLPNEVRVLEGLNEIEGLDDAAQEPDPPEPVAQEVEEPEDDESDELRAFEPILIATVERILTRQRKALGSATESKRASFFELQADVWAESLLPIFEGLDAKPELAEEFGERFAERHHAEALVAVDVSNGLWSAPDLVREIFDGLR